MAEARSQAHISTHGIVTVSSLRGPGNSIQLHCSMRCLRLAEAASRTGVRRINRHGGRVLLCFSTACSFRYLQVGVSPAYKCRTILLHEVGDSGGERGQVEFCTAQFPEVVRYP